MQGSKDIYNNRIKKIIKWIVNDGLSISNPAYLKHCHLGFPQNIITKWGQNFHKRRLNKHWTVLNCLNCQLSLKQNSRKLIHLSLSLHLFVSGTKHSICTCWYQEQKHSICTCSFLVQNTQYVPFLSGTEHSVCTCYNTTFAPVPTWFKTLNLHLFLPGTKHSICTIPIRYKNTKFAPVPTWYKTLNLHLFLPVTKHSI